MAKCQQIERSCSQGESPESVLHLPVVEREVVTQSFIVFHTQQAAQHVGEIFSVEQTVFSGNPLLQNLC
jgi:hypothetical protein